MKYAILILLLALHYWAKAQPFTNYYIDTAGNKKVARIEFLDGEHNYNHDRRVSITDPGMPPRVATSEAIREFNLYGDRYLSVPNGEHHYFMRVLVDSPHLKRLLREGYKTYVEYAVDGVLVPHALGDPKKEWLARVFAAYPLMSDMALHGGLDDSGYEDSLLFVEYDKWMDADSLHKKDTSMALRGMIDANQVRLPPKYFWREFWYAHFTGLIGVAIRQHNQPVPPFSSLPVYNPAMMANPDYARGYRLRLLTRTVHLIRKGRLMGALLPPVVFI